MADKNKKKIDRCFGESVNFDVPSRFLKEQGRDIESLNQLKAKPVIVLDKQKEAGTEYLEILGVLPPDTSRVIDDSGGIYDSVRLTNKEKIERNIPLSDVMSIYNIAMLWSDDKRKRKIHMDAIYLAFYKGELKGVQLERPPNCEARFYGAFMDIEIHKNDFKSWLESNNEVLPNDCLLVHWWEDEQKANKSICICANNELKNNDVEYSGLLNAPKKIDGWFEVIDDMTKDFFKKNGYIPSNQTMAWGQLWSKPLEGYEIKTVKDEDKTRGNDSLEMPGIKP
ncbi:MAG: hypothetical protein KAI17_01420, partial [Thiotrichaceae bacterium]|nr:hypothetical protein [Thiotrichaceae bacterium]